MAVGIGRENALLYDVIMRLNRHCSDLLDTSYSYRLVRWGEQLELKQHLQVEVLVSFHS
jgi:hypothetical protein